ncbi:MAG: hypothetical protein ACRDFQ_09915 [Anaerolineales bacterium]
MVWIQSIFEKIPAQWVILGLITSIGVSVVFLRWLIRLALRAFVIGIVGVILLGALYYLFNSTGFQL